MNTGFSVLLAVGALMPGFFLFQFFRDAWNKYKASGKYFWETLRSSPVLFFICPAVFLGFFSLSVRCLIN